MSKLSVTLLFIGLSLLVVCDGSPMSSESSESNETVEVDQIMELVSARCIKRIGFKDAFQNLMVSFERAMTCLADFHLDKFKTDFDLLSNATRRTFFSEYCPKTRSLVSCIDGSLRGMQPCLKESVFKIAEAMIDSIPTALDLACENDGEIIFKLKDEKRQKCMKQKAEELSTCANTPPNRRNVDFDFTVLTQENCSILTNIRRCVTNKLVLCDLSEVAIIYDIPINAILRLPPCGNVNNVVERDSGASLEHSLSTSQTTEEQKVSLIENNTIVEV
uniref:Putative conserved secreted protein n=1 Tax=Anopheles triannulatus TaxID=58253 RepID=A0A2M4ATQ0_9DIPT